MIESKNKPQDKLNANVNPSDCCDELLIEYIDSFGSNLANLRQDIREIIREEVDKKFDSLVKQLRRDRDNRYVEVGYRGGSY